MGADDRLRWDEKHRVAAPSSPDATLASLLPRIPRGGRALDLACGTGQNAELLAGRGYRVDAVDVSGEALRRARGRVTGAIRAIQMDLDAPALADAPAWDLVLCVSFLDRALLRRIPGWVRPGGLLYFSTFHRGHLAGRPHFRPEWVLERDEVRTLFPDLEPLARGETDVRAFVLARRGTGVNRPG